MKLTYTLMGNQNNFRWYDSYYKYNPDANYKRFENALNNTLTFTHTVSMRTFYEVKYHPLLDRLQAHISNEDPSIRSPTTPTPPSPRTAPPRSPTPSAGIPRAMSMAIP